MRTQKITQHEKFRNHLAIFSFFFNFVSCLLLTLVLYFFIFYLLISNTKKENYESIFFISDFLNNLSYFFSNQDHKLERKNRDSLTKKRSKIWRFPIKQLIFLIHLRTSIKNKEENVLKNREYI
jgi:hypothetical protein